MSPESMVNLSFLIQNRVRRKRKRRGRGGEADADAEGEARAGVGGRKKKSVGPVRQPRGGVNWLSRKLGNFFA